MHLVSQIGLVCSDRVGRVRDNGLQMLRSFDVGAF